LSAAGPALSTSARQPGKLSIARDSAESEDGLEYEFKLRQGLKFHNGDPFTAEDVKFSFHRYRGTSAKLLHGRVKAVEIIDPHRVRFVLHTAWSDFLVFYATPATGAAWIVPKSYIEKVGEDGFRRHPVGLGPYRFSRMTPGVELVLEVNEQYWRKRTSIRQVVIKGVPDRTTRLAMLKTGEADTRPRFDPRCAIVVPLPVPAGDDWVPAVAASSSSGALGERLLHRDCEFRTASILRVTGSSLPQQIDPQKRKVCARAKSYRSMP
jgi:ABC-type transport system substrate-binding protein